MNQPSRLAPLLLTEDEAAAALRLSPRTLRDLRAAGKLQYVLIGARKIAYRPEDIEGYVLGNLRKAEPDSQATAPTKRGKPCKANRGNVVPFTRQNR